MILVTLGTQKEQFTRLLNYIENSNIKDKIIVQAGYTKFKSKKNNIKIFDFISYDEMNEYIDQADIIITHSGTGSVLMPLKKGKKVIVCSRLAKYGEHVDNHQVELTEVFRDGGYVLELTENNNLDDLIKKINKFKPKKYVSNTSNFINKLQNEIDSNNDHKPILISILFLMLLIIILLLLVIRPQKVLSSTENRNLNQISFTNINKFLSGDFQSSLDEALPDQIFLSETLKKYGNKINSLSKEFSLHLFFDYEKYDIIPVSDGFFKIKGTDYLIYDKSNSEGLQNNSKRYFNLINDVYSKFSDKNVYVFKVNREYDFMFSDDYDKFATEYLNKNIQYSSFTSLDSFDKYMQYFYKSDHHWNNKGQYAGYLDLVKLLKIKNPIEINNEKCFNIKFRGSKAKQIGDTSITDDFCVNLYNIGYYESLVNGKDSLISYSRSLYLDGKVPKYSDTNHYANYFGPDYGEIVYHYIDNENKQSILVFGDSYANPLKELIAANYNYSYFIDIRNYSNLKGEDFNLSEYLKKHKVDNILFIGNINLFITDQFIFEVGE